MRLRRFLASVSCAAAVAWGSPALAQNAAGATEPPTAQEKSAARALAREGDALWAEERYAEALDRFTRAHELVRAPALMKRQADCLEKLGRLVEASEKYTTVARTRITPASPAAVKKAAAESSELARAIRARLPMLKVTLTGQALEGATLTLDGKDVPEAVWGAAFPVDPGAHDLVLEKGERRATASVELAEQEAGAVELFLEGGEQEVEVAPPPAEPPPPAPPPVAAPLPQRPPPDTDAGLGDTQRLLGFVSLGAGAAGLATGSVVGGLALGTRSDLDEVCNDDRRCPSSVASDVDQLNRQRLISSIGFGVGGVGLVGGLVLILTAPRKDASARPVIGPRYVGVGGRF